MHIFLSQEVRIPSSISVVAGGIHSLGSYVTVRVLIVLKIFTEGIEHFSGGSILVCM